MIETGRIEDFQKAYEIVDAMLGERIEPTVHTLITEYADGLGWQPSQVIEAILLNFGALVTASETLYGATRSVFLPFLLDGEDRPVLGRELFKALVERYAVDFLDDREAEAQIRELERDRKAHGR